MTYNPISDNLSVMIIDFHTHYYPDDLAYRALHGVDDVCEGDNDGTYRGLKKAMQGLAREEVLVKDSYLDTDLDRPEDYERARALLQGSACGD